MCRLVDDAASTPFAAVDDIRVPTALAHTADALAVGLTEFGGPVWDGRIELRDPTTGAFRAATTVASGVSALAATAAGDLLAGCNDGRIALYDAKTLSDTETRYEHARSISAIVCNDATGFVTGSRDGQVKVWDLGNETSMSTFKHSSEVTDVAFVAAADGNVLSASTDGTVRLWDARCDSVGDEVARFRGDMVRGAAWRKLDVDGTQVSAISDAGVFASLDLRNLSAPVFETLLKDARGVPLELVNVMARPGTARNAELPREYLLLTNDGSLRNAETKGQDLTLTKEPLLKPADRQGFVSRSLMLSAAPGANSAVLTVGHKLFRVA